MSQWINDKVQECAAEVARLDAQIAELTEQRKRAEMGRLAFLGKLVPVAKLPKPRRRRQARGTNGSTAASTVVKREEARLRIGTTAARKEERRKVRDGERVPVDRVET